MPAPRASASRSYAWQGRSDQGRFYRKYRWPQLSKNRMLARGSASKRNFAAFTSTWPLLQGRQHRAPLPLPRPPTIETSTSPKHNYKRLVQSVFSTSGDAYRLQPALQWSSYVLAQVRDGSTHKTSTGKRQLQPAQKNYHAPTTIFLLAAPAPRKRAGEPAGCPPWTHGGHALMLSVRSAGAGAHVPSQKLKSLT